MMMAVEAYLAVRRAAGFTLSNPECLLRSFARFAAERKQTHIRTATAIEWASLAASVAQRHTRYQTVYRFAQYLRLEDPQHDLPPTNHFGYRKRRRVPHIYSREEIAGLVRAALRLPPADGLQPQDLWGADQLVGRHRAAHLGGVASTGLRLHGRRVADSQHQISENPVGSVARHGRHGVRALPEAAPSKAPWG
jgi:integrase